MNPEPTLSTVQRDNPHGTEWKELVREYNCGPDSLLGSFDCITFCSREGHLADYVRFLSPDSQFHSVGWMLGAN